MSHDEIQVAQALARYRSRGLTVSELLCALYGEEIDRILGGFVKNQIATKVSVNGRDVYRPLFFDTIEDLYKTKTTNCL